MVVLLYAQHQLVKAHALADVGILAITVAKTMDAKGITKLSITMRELMRFPLLIE